jgi:hypothetical protein
LFREEGRGARSGGRKLTGKEEGWMKIDSKKGNIGKKGTN